ncbi:MAG: hypothetical protein ACYDBZ_15000 [Steroidobacteraceae bacterium]
MIIKISYAIALRLIALASTMLMATVAHADDWRVDAGLGVNRRGRLTSVLAEQASNGDQSQSGNCRSES